MKKSLVLLLVSGLLLQGTSASAGEKVSGRITISGAWALYPLAVKWGQEFRKEYPDVRVDVSAGGAGKGLADALSGVVDIGMVSRDIHPEEIKRGAWWVSVAKDAVVPVMNAKNPSCRILNSKGIKKEKFSAIWISEKAKTWSDICGEKVEGDVHVYTRSDSCGAAETWAKYMGKKQDDLAGVGVYGDPGLALAVKKDVWGIGYNNVNFVYDAKTKKTLEGLFVVPIDVNNNGKIDKEESFYGSRDEIMSAIAEGKYPSPPARDLHFAHKGKPEKKAVVVFLNWVLTKGQKFVTETGYIELNKKTLDEQIKKLK
jgi:phosphate transport system substrate-binding protein